jgi:4-carboxymuconolactone decarboxylase
MEVRTSVLGDAHIARTEVNKTAFDEDYQRLITESAWGSVWTREGLTKRERSLLVIAFMTALGHHDELAMHIRATANTGATLDDIKEVLLMAAIYAGVPAANAAFAVAKKTYTEMGIDLGEPEDSPS